MAAMSVKRPYQPSRIGGRRAEKLQSAAPAPGPYV
jgi:hypothetical protein